MYFNCILFLTDEIVTCHTVESFYRFYDKNDHKNTIFPIQSRSRVRSRKCDSHRHSTTSFSENVVVAKTSCQMLGILSFSDRERA